MIEGSLNENTFRRRTPTESLLVYSGSPIHDSQAEIHFSFILNGKFYFSCDDVMRPNLPNQFHQIRFLTSIGYRIVRILYSHVICGERFLLFLKPQKNFPCIFLGKVTRLIGFGLIKQCKLAEGQKVHTVDWSVFGVRRWYKRNISKNKNTSYRFHFWLICLCEMSFSGRYARETRNIFGQNIFCFFFFFSALRKNRNETVSQSWKQRKINVISDRI